MLGAIVIAKEADALDCGSPLFYPRSAGGTPQAANSYSLEQLEDIGARGTLHLLETTAILLRGRVASVRDLVDRRRTSEAISLVILEDVDILRGQLPPASRDRRAFLIEWGWCDGLCGDKPPDSSSRRETAVFAARPNILPYPSRVTDTLGTRVVYRGRIDALMPECTLHRLSPMALELLNSPEEIARLKREYPQRPSN
jgi:hypothetical protein